VADDRGLRSDQSVGASVADREEPAEVIDDLFGVEADGFGVVADEGARNQTPWPQRQVVGFEPNPKVDAHVGQQGKRLERHPAALPFAPEARPKGILFGHGNPTDGGNSRACRRSRIRHRFTCFDGQLLTIL
jgi:hypothetical protein